MNMPNLDPTLPVHPTFLYELIGNVLIFALIVFVQNKLLEQQNGIYRAKEAGVSMALYCLLYGALRFFVEGIRTDSLYIGQTNLRVSQLVSLLMVLAGLIYALYYLHARRKEMN